LKDSQKHEKREAFKEELAGFLEASKKEQELLQVWKWDESGFSLRVIRHQS